MNTNVESFAPLHNHKIYFILTWTIPLAVQIYKIATNLQINMQLNLNKSMTFLLYIKTFGKKAHPYKVQASKTYRCAEHTCVGAPLIRNEGRWKSRQACYHNLSSYVFAAKTTGGPQNAPGFGGTHRP